MTDVRPRVFSQSDPDGGRPPQPEPESSCGWSSAAGKGPVSAVGPQQTDTCSVRPGPGRGEGGVKGRTGPWPRKTRTRSQWLMGPCVMREADFRNVTGQDAAFADHRTLLMLQRSQNTLKRLGSAATRWALEPFLAHKDPNSKDRRDFESQTQTFVFTL